MSADETKDRLRKGEQQRAFKAVQLAALIIAGYSVYILTTADSLRHIHENSEHIVDPPAEEGPEPIIIPSAGKGALDLETIEYNKKTFMPGSLNMSRAETLHRCYVDPNGFYKSHLGDGLCVVSDSYKMEFYHVRKSGSSTGRHISVTQFKGRDMHRCRAGTRNDFYKVAFVRNPITRFFAQYEETFVRTLPGKGPKVPKKYDVFHSDLKDYKAYERLFCGDAAKRPRERGKPKPCDQIPSQDDGNLARRFEKFVEVWDGHVFEAHLAMQAPILSGRAGRAFKVDFVGDTKHTNEHWQEIGRHLGKNKVDVLRGRAYPRRMNISYITTKSYQRICRIAAIDFCCLNFELPPQCVDAGVSCRWENHGGEDLIVPVIKK